jgi:phage tail sheath protein FI
MDDNWKYQYDKYNNVNRWLPCNPDTAGLWARVATINSPWESAAGYNRGQLKNVTRLAWNSDKPSRDQLFKKQVNSIVSFQGSGTLLFGDKTLLTRPSVFSGANVRYLFIILRKSIAETAKYQLFELNTTATRSRFANQVTQFLRNIQSKQGIIQFMVIADERNNTEQVINEGRFVAQIAVLPPQSIRNVVLEFSAVNGAAQFDEIEQALGA